MSRRKQGQNLLFHSGGPLQVSEGPNIDRDHHGSRCPTFPHKTGLDLVPRRSMDDAKIAFIGSDAYLQTSIDVANVALDYAYWIHRYDPYNYYPWSYVPYGNSVFVHSGNWWGRY